MLKFNDVLLSILYHKVSTIFKNERKDYRLIFYMLHFFIIVLYIYSHPFVTRHIEINYNFYLF